MAKATTKDNKYTDEIHKEAGKMHPTVDIPPGGIVEIESYEAFQKKATAMIGESEKTKRPMRNKRKNSRIAEAEETRYKSGSLPTIDPVSQRSGGNAPETAGPKEHGEPLSKAVGTVKDKTPLKPGSKVMSYDEFCRQAKEVQQS